MMSGLCPEIQTTADGSVTLYREDIDEHYHSVKGALAESRRVYLELGWEAAAASRKKVTVFEVGFGTGLNAALTALAADSEQVTTTYFAVELYPLPADIISRLSPLRGEEYGHYFKKVNGAEWDKPVEFSPFFTLNKINADLLSMQLPRGIDVVYFDAFAPEKQPQMWSESIFRRLFEAMNGGALLTTYCAKGSIRRMLQDIGFSTERLAGPPGGKREVLRATKPLTI